MSGTRVALVATVVVAAIPLALARGASEPPRPLHGARLEERTGLRLAVAYVAPFLLDVDSRRVTRIRGIRNGTWVVGIGGRAAVVVADPFSQRGRVYGFRGRLARLGAGAEAAPGRDGTSVWVKRIIGHSRCTLRQVRLDGHLVRGPKPFRCASSLAAGGSLGVQVSDTRIIDPRTGTTVFRSPRDRLGQRLGILAVAGKSVLLQDGPGRPLVLLDTTSGVRRQIDWPSNIGQLDTPAVDVGGRRIALSFANPSWTGRAGQAFDAWVLDTRTSKLTHLPGMPAFVWLKWTNMAWTQGGRLVILTRDETRQMVALWRPGHKRLGLKNVRLPNHDSAPSDTFAIVG